MILLKFKPSQQRPGGTSTAHHQMRILATVNTDSGLADQLLVHTDRLSGASLPREPSRLLARFQNQTVSLLIAI